MLDWQIAFLAPMETFLHVVLKRPGTTKFNNHAFTFDSPAKAAAVAKTLSMLTNKAFAKLRDVARMLKDAAPPAVPARRGRPDEEQAWYHGVLPRANADALLMAHADPPNGLFLVRQSERSPTDYVLSFIFQGKVYHNKITRQPDGWFSSSWGSWYVRIASR